MPRLHGALRPQRGPAADAPGSSRTGPRIVDFDFGEIAWEELSIPGVDMAFFFHNTQAERVTAFYPGPMGATESLLELGAWEALRGGKPGACQIEADVEALLVTAPGARGTLAVPIDECYLVALIRTRWRG